MGGEEVADLFVVAPARAEQCDVARLETHHQALTAVDRQPMVSDESFGQRRRLPLLLDLIVAADIEVLPPDALHHPARLQLHGQQLVSIGHGAIGEVVDEEGAQLLDIQLAQVVNDARNGHGVTGRSHRC